MTNIRIVQGLSIVAMVLVGCGGAEGGGEEGSGKPPPATPKPKPPGTSPVTDTDETEHVATSDKLCSVKGDKGNNLSVGKFCEKGSDACTDGSFCTGDFIDPPPGAVFCSRFCSKDADCGEGATCFQEERGRACVPSKCLETK